MTQKTSPFSEVKYGWDLGESGWNTGMDENLVKFSFFLNSSIDAVVSSLPTLTNGSAYFLTTDKRLYYVVDSVAYSSPTPPWFVLKLKSNGSWFVFDGTNLVSVGNPSQLQANIDLKAPIDSPTFTGNVNGITKAMVGLSNVDNTSDINKPVSTAQQNALNLKASLSSLASSTGSSLVGYNSNVPNSVNRNAQTKFSDTISVKDFGAVGDGIADDTIPFQNAIAYASSIGNCGVYIPSGNYVVTGGLQLGSGTKRIGVYGNGRTSRIKYSATTSLFNAVGGISELVFKDFTIDNTGNNTTLANACFNFPEGNTNTDFINVHCLPDLSTNNTVPSFYLCGVGKTNDSINFYNCYIFVNKMGIRTGAGSSIYIIAGRIIGSTPLTQASTGLLVSGGMGGVWILSTDVIGLTTGVSVAPTSGSSNREIFLQGTCIDSCGTGLSITDSSSYTSWEGVWAASAYSSCIEFAPTADTATLNLTGGTVFNAGALDSATPVYNNYGLSINQFGRLLANGITFRNNKTRAVSFNSGARTVKAIISKCHFFANGTSGRANTAQVYLAGKAVLRDNDFEVVSGVSNVLLDSASTSLMEISNNAGYKGVGLRTGPALTGSNVDITNNTGQVITGFFRNGVVASIWKNSNPVYENATAAPLNGSVILNPGDTYRVVYNTAPSITWDFN